MSRLVKKENPLIVASLVGGCAYFVLRAFQPKKDKYTKKYPPLPPFTENRVRLHDYGPLKPNSPLLVSVPAIQPNQTLHVLAAKRFMALREAAAKDGFPDVRLSNGYREDTDPKKRDQNGNPCRPCFEAYLKQRYGSVREGYRWRAFYSPHETGLAMDFGNHGLRPISKTNSIQLQTPFYAWLKANAHRFGITPYKGEAWHWEVRVPYDAWASGNEFTDDYAVFIPEGAKPA